jgi:hypothetical protein
MLEQTLSPRAENALICRSARGYLTALPLDGASPHGPSERCAIGDGHRFWGVRLDDTELGDLV